MYRSAQLVPRADGIGIGRVLPARACSDCHDSCPRVARPFGVSSRGDETVLAEASSGGRYWARTSDPSLSIASTLGLAGSPFSFEPVVNQWPRLVGA